MEIPALDAEIANLESKKAELLATLEAKVAERKILLRKMQLIARYKNAIKPEDVEELKALVLKPGVVEVQSTITKL